MVLGIYILVDLVWIEYVDFDCWVWLCLMFVYGFVDGLELVFKYLGVLNIDNGVDF